MAKKKNGRQKTKRPLDEKRKNDTANLENEEEEEIDFFICV